MSNPLLPDLYKNAAPPYAVVTAASRAEGTFSPVKPMMARLLDDRDSRDSISKYMSPRRVGRDPSQPRGFNRSEKMDTIQRNEISRESRIRILRASV